MKLKKRYLLALVIVLFLLVGAAVFLRNKQQTLTSYEDSNGWVYQCSKPIKAKNGTSQVLGHPQGPVPIDASESSTYCHKVGIE